MLRIVRSYKYLLLILSLSLAISLVRGQGSSGPVIINDSVMMIGPDVESLTEEQIYFNPTYLVVDPSKEHLRDQLIRACACDCDTSVPNRRIGVFSVAKGKRVTFSQGSLQYLPAANLWKFADAQYEYLHNSNKYNSPIYRNWVDLFDWRGVAGVSFDDWGKNAICGDTSQTWRTLSADEWKYLLHDRKHATELLLPAMVENTLGLVVLPDDWVCPEGVALVTLSQTNVTWDEAQRVYTYSSNIYFSNVFSLTSWQRMEEAGAVFMPASGYINKDGVLNACGTTGRYWSSSPNKNTKGYYMSFGIAPNSATNSIRTQSAVNADKGHTVRLVHDTIMPLPLPCETFEVKGVTFNMMCVEGETYDYLIGETEVTRALWKAVMGNLPNSYTASNAPIDNVSWGECQQFIQKLNQLTGQHFRFPTKAEWLYAAKGGKNNEGFLYSGSDNIDEVGWYSGNSVGGGQPVATLKPNDLGIYDMTGNVWEWVAKTGKNNYPYMGGSYAFSAEKCLLSKASGVASEANHKGSIGLRLVLDKHTYVDLGLSVMWATTNVGAESAEEFGDYFAWGETEPKEVYDWSTYKWCNGTEDNMTKYNATDGLTTLLPEDDAAHVNWGGEWRMASDAEWTELREQCDWKWTTINGTKGYTVTGPNGNSIFLSAAGFYYASGLSYVNNHGDYWSGTRNSTSASGACHVYFTSDLLIRSNSWRYYGFPVRPVLPADREILTPATPGKRIGVFSVAGEKRVSFSQGNLQYVQYRDEWRFAENQYDYIGEDNMINGMLDERIDLFGWSVNNTTAPFGVSTSTNNADYAGEFVDWGTNIIQGDAANTWRTLSKEEWEYLIKGRKNASNLRAAAQVNGVNGMILLPDDWECPEGIDFKAGYHTSKGSEYYAEYQQFTKEQWRELETTGAIFLPAAGMHDGNGIADIQAGGYYWSATDNGDTYAYTLISQSSGAYLTYDNRYDVRSVRLVHDTIVPPPAPCQTFEVKGVTFNMMCVEGGTFMMGATEEDSTANKNEFPQHQVTLSDYMVLQTEVTKEQWLAVMGTKPQGANSTWGTGDVTTPANYVTWSECVDFTHRLSQLTGQNFRLLTEAEWEFAARGGNKSRGYRYSGSDNLDEVGWYIQNRQSTTHPVAQKRPNELGIYDMSGNVWEWCLDSPQDYKDYAQVNPLGAFVNHQRVIRGGAYEREEYRCTNTHRTTWLSAWSNKGANTGFRVVLNNNHVVHTLLLNDTVAFNMKFVEGEMYDYKIAQTEVTQGLWEQVMGYNNSLFKGEYLPVEKVSWEECQTFIQKLNEMTGKHFRLPTEAEWEYAAHGGKNSRGSTYAGSNSIDSVAWYQANSQEQTHTIATLMPNELGIYDMSGNVWEWCQDYYDASAQRVVRGGSFYDVASVCRISSRGGRDANYRSYIGLRLVLDEHEYVDLGLSVMWATTNVGAESAEEFGDYFAWGETEPKEVYDWSTYKWCDCTEDNMTKYNATDGLTTLLPEDDAAHVNWGGEWRMASDVEFQELIDNCLFEITNHNGVKGTWVTSKINGNRIFIPYAGYYNHGNGGTADKNYSSQQRLWTSSSIGRATHAKDYCNQAIEGNTRRCGFPIRPVVSAGRDIQIPPTPGKRIGVFSVAKDKQVSFSQGNLQYIQSANLWRFAENQYDYLGAGNVKDGQLANRIDLFGWSGNNTTAPFGISTSTNNADYAGEFVDWGTNIIQGDAANTWRTLSPSEWQYLYALRPNANLLHSKGSVDGIRGIIILPDDWQLPEGLHFTAVPDDLDMDMDVNVYTKAQWAKMQEVGAVFLPVAARRTATEVKHLQYYVGIWTSTIYNVYFNFSDKAYSLSNNGNLYDGRSVRLVHDTIVPKVEPEYVDLGLSVKWATFNVGATSPEDYGDYFAWGETEPKEIYSWATYKWGTSSNLTKYNTTDGKTILDSEDDAAYVHWGGKWRMPSKEEVDELTQQCNWIWTTHNNVNGYKVTGPNGNSIFLPAAGYKGAGPTYPAGEDGLYWTNTTEKQHYSYLIVLHDDAPPTQAGTQGTRCFGFAVRAVYDDRPPKRIGVFSVGADKQVSFSQGNVQYTQSTDEWRFAREQYEYIGAANIGNGNLADKIDLFGWSADNTTAPFGISTSTNVTDYASDFVDWGTNAISGDAPGIWRTLSADEWEYLLEKRKNASNLYGVAKVAGENGLIILPDDWKAPEGIIFKAGLHSSQVNDFSVYQSFTADEWKVMEEAGAVFLHASGYRDGATVEKCNTSGYYWSNTTSNGDDAYRMYFYSYFLGPKDVHSKYRGRSVRLVHDTIVPPPAPCQTFEVKGISFNMMCVEGGTFVMGSDASSNEQPMHQVTIPDFLIGQTEVTQELWQVVMGNNPSHFKGAENPVEYVSWSDCQKFIANLNQLTGKKFRLPTEAEWEYAARGGQMSKDFVFSGSDNVDKVGWYTNNSGAMSHPVKQKLPNELGIYDMSSNVWEWCQDWYGDYSTDTQINPQGPSSGSVRVIRGGSWMNDANDCRVSRRLDLTPAARTSNLGLRLVLDKHEYVDLGLSVLWATTNVGAESSEEYGDYFAWGETEPKEAYSWDTYKWCNSADTSITKYNNADGMTTLLPEDDAATVNWGGKWRTPTKEELAELRLSCTWEWTTLNGINGHQVTGPNGNSIFIPAGGSYNQFNHEISGVGIQGWFYASDRGAARQANEIGTPAKGPYSGSCSRCCGLTIRPVCEKDSNIVTVIIDPTPANSNVGLYSRYEGSVKVTRSIRVEKGNDVLYQVSNTENGYLSQGDTLYKVMRDTVLKVSLKPFTEGNWETVDLTGLTRYDNYYISRNRGIFAGPYSNWCYYVMPVNSGETYRVSSHAGQLAALWFIASTPPDYENKIPPTKVNCSKNGGIVGYIAEEFTVPDGGNYLIINASPNKTPVVERLVVECCTFTQEEWDAAVNLWGHQGRAHTPADQSCIQGTYVNGVRLKIGKVGGLNVYKVPTLLETTEDNFELVATLTTDSLGVQDFDFPTPIYLAENEYLVFGKPSEPTPTLHPCYHPTLPKQTFAHFIGTDKAKIGGTKASLMVGFY